jgi:hypothetical protein
VGAVHTPIKIRGGYLSTPAPMPVYGWTGAPF